MLRLENKIFTKAFVSKRKWQYDNMPGNPKSLVKKKKIYNVTDSQEVKHRYYSWGSLLRFSEPGGRTNKTAFHFNGNTYYFKHFWFSASLQYHSDWCPVKTEAQNTAVRDAWMKQVKQFGWASQRFHQTLLSITWLWIWIDCLLAILARIKVFRALKRWDTFIKGLV